MFLCVLPDLIDTLWNVKISNKIYTEEAGKDLIDTLWNVKKKKQGQSGCG